MDKRMFKQVLLLEVKGLRMSRLSLLLLKES